MTSVFLNEILNMLNILNCRHPFSCQWEVEDIVLLPLNVCINHSFQLIDCI